MTAPAGYTPAAIATPAEHRGARPSVFRFTGDLEALAADLLDRLGPAAVVVLAHALLALAAEVAAHG